MRSLIRRRSIFIAAAALAVLAAAVWYFAPSYRGRSAAELIPYLPPADAAVMYVDVAALRVSGVLDMLAGSQLAEEPEYQAFVRDTGFDYRKDLNTVLLSFQEKGTFLVLSGRFDWKAIHNYVSRQGGTCVNGLCRVSGSTPQRRISFYKLKRDLMAMAVSSDEFAASLITHHERVPQFETPSEPVWVSVPASAIRKEGLPAGTRTFASALEGAERFSLALGSNGERFEILLRVTCRNAEEASALRDQLEKATTVLRNFIARENQKPNPNDLSGVLTAGVFSQEDRRVLGRWPMERSFLQSVTGGQL